MKRTVFFAIFLLLASCQTKPSGHVTTGPTYPKGDCEELGQVIGTSGTRKDAKENAMADLRHEAANLGGNYVRVVAVSAYGAAARGIAYRCQ